VIKTKNQCIQKGKIKKNHGKSRNKRNVHWSRDLEGKPRRKLFIRWLGGLRGKPRSLVPRPWWKIKNLILIRILRPKRRLLSSRLFTPFQREL
jgi:hypothetical protein